MSDQPNQPKAYPTTTAGQLWGQPPPVLDWVWPGLLAGTLGLVVSPGGAGKSWWALGACAAVAAGRDLQGLLGADPAAGPTLYVCLEDPAAILAHRLHALRPYCAARADAVAEGLHVLPLSGQGAAIGTITRDGALSPSDEWLRVEATARAIHPRLLVIDTLNRALGGIPETEALGLVVLRLEALARATNSAIVLLHHVSKYSLATGSAADDQHAARGSSVLSASVRWQANMLPMSRADAEARGLDEVVRKKWVRWVQTKGNYGEATEDRWLLRDERGVLVGGHEPPPPDDESDNVIKLKKDRRREKTDHV